jgi:hydroxymethylglutaryl-CoA reductase (NADPH)
VTDGAIAPVLAELVRAHPVGTELVAHVSPPVHFKVTIPTSAKPKRTKRPHGLILFDNFLSEWTNLVGDPVMSKWIIVTLGVSILLNAFLLKGISLGAGSKGGPGGAAAAAAAALLGVWEVVDTNGEPSSAPSPATGKKAAAAEGLAIQLDPGLNRYKAEVAQDARLHTLEAVRPSLTTQTSANLTPRIEKPMPGLTVSEPALIIGGPSDRPQLDGLANGNGPVALPAGTVLDMRPLDECVEILKGGLGPFELSDEEVIMLVQKGKIPPYALEKTLQNLERAVKIRRAVICPSPFV